MRVALIVVLCLLNAGCALWRKDQAEPVENKGPRQDTETGTGPAEKPSEVLKPESSKIASPVTDRFYMRGTFFSAKPETTLRLDPSATVEGTTLSGEDDLGLDDQVEQPRIELDFRLGERNHVRIDYFKLNRFAEQPLPRDIVFGDLTFDAGENFRTKLDWRVLTFTYTYSLVRSERFEAGLGLGIHLIEAHASGGQPGTLQFEEADEVGIFPTIAVNAAYRISRRWSVTLRGQQFSANPEDFDGTMADYHGDVQFRLSKNLSLGLGYTMLKTDLLVVDEEEPLLFNLETSGPELFFRASF